MLSDSVDDEHQAAPLWRPYDFGAAYKCRDLPTYLTDRSIYHDAYTRWRVKVAYTVIKDRAAVNLRLTSFVFQPIGELALTSDDWAARLFAPPNVIGRRVCVLQGKRPDIETWQLGKEQRDRDVTKLGTRPMYLGTSLVL